MNTHRSASLRATCALLSCLALASLAFGPCGPLPGGRLAESTSSAPVQDWSFANDVKYCAVEVQPEAPRSVTVNCMSTEGRLYVSCSECAGKTWSALAVENPAGRVRIGEQVLPVSLRRVQDPAELDAVWLARAAKTGDEPSPRPDEWWTFELRSR